MDKMLYEGKAKQVFLTENENEYLIHYKDDATAFNGEKKDIIMGKGELNLAISTVIFEMLEKSGIKTHYIKTVNKRDMIVKKVTILPLEVIIRNISAGSICKRLDLEEGIQFKEPIFEICYKDDKLGDPLINDDHAVALNLIERSELKQIKKVTLEINKLLIEFFKKVGLKLIDFKIEFGKTIDGEIILADEISPDTCRLWDVKTNEKMDKDRFRRDLGNLIEGYEEVLKRIRG
ncbi:phosphoribosylaminoimidazolesuccinocarboxamide synthase [Proteocatella sphenisci]|uniref:phosphoribosylaminoimidazolesuccinocarboxamide synthase n=1 Tax=Proteocatella sphenisci TaxID=181070 RepID=UPI00049117D5|nr:phosphoribosylaminoimidazolesuccinocarboxamide synthase [Proteocatella sphenisci]